MPTNTKEKILESAENCLFQHGYQKTNMSLVSKYSGFSRVTVHKHFCTKKHLLRAVVSNYFESNFKMVEQHIEAHPEFTAWQAIEYLIEVMAHPIFERINDQYVLEDLDKACNENANDIKLEMQQKKISYIQKHIDRGIEENEISLDKVGINSLELAILLNNSLEGIIKNTDLNKTKAHINAMFQVYKASTSPKNFH